MITFIESKEQQQPKETEKCLDSQLWHACAGSIVQMPAINSKVFYFPQGHAEHASENLGFVNFPRAPPYVHCCVSGVKFMADPETDEVFAKIHLTPVPMNEPDFDESVLIRPDNQEKPASFAKTLTQSDANNGGGFSVPRYCAETIFPRLDYSADPPVQTILAKDVQGETWKFRHIYRGTPRRHLLTTGWSSFVNHKKLVAGDSIVFLRAENGDLCVGIRRAKRGIGGGPEMQTGWNYGGYFRDDESSRLNRNVNGNVGLISGRERVKREDVIEAAGLAAGGRAFEVVYYPRASTPEFCVKADLVKAAMQIQWCSGMRFKMAFETEDSSRISWFMGTVSSAQVADPIRWSNSPWRLLQVAWDEPDLLQNVKRVSPWLVELVSNMPSIHHLSPFSPPRKKPRLPNNQEFPLDGQIPFPPFSGSPFGCLPKTPAGMQGARHAQYGLSLSDHHFNKTQSNFLQVGFLPTVVTPKPGSSENVSCQLTMGGPARCQSPDQKPNNGFVLFGQKILTEKQILSVCCSNDTVNNSSSDGSGSAHILDDPDQCKVFMESEDVGRTIDLSSVGSYEEMYRKLADMFGIEISDIVNRVVYRGATGPVRRAGDGLFSDFVKIARRLTIVAGSSSDNVGV
ncbi:hypothetical protein CASFOL_013401 [Castilleja foliolosa]|uniref:Auxin response factor n=1 Tax=Castilleja foliolosa TaxID=1961234 RepID=A0ABD3DLP6_9LAMI